MLAVCIALRRAAAIAALVPALVSTGAWAATTGRVAGTVTDAASGAPLPGVGVVVHGTRLGATTDPSGRYFIIQVPPGEHTISAQLVGYRTTSVTQVRVNADLTTEVNLRLSEEAIEVGEVIVTAQREAIDADVTSSQIIVDAAAVAEMPVSKMLNILSFEPGVSVNDNNELTIRGGGPSEIQFQVDGMARTDPITGKGQAQINQVLVAEVTVLTGGFNAEYGNIRSGVVNAVLRDGSEGGSLPSVQGAVSYGPAQRKHFGPGAYDEDQYDYMIMSSQSPFADRNLPMNNFGEVLWPYLYEETATHQPTLTAMAAQKTKYRALASFTGWDRNVQRNNQRELNIDTYQWMGSYDKNDWTAEELRTAWEYEANMNEQAWSYADRPDVNADLAASWALPNELGGIVFGYSHNRVMTPVPARVRYARDVSYDGKLTLTPMDGLKLSLRYHRQDGLSTGGGSRNVAATNAELAESNTSVWGGDPVSLRSFSDLIQTLTQSLAAANKVQLSFNSPLESGFEQIGGSITYAVSTNAYLSAYFGRSTSTYRMDRDLPRVDPNSWEGRYQPNYAWNFQGWLNNAYDWTDLGDDGLGDPPVDMADALDPSRIIFRTKYMSNVRSSVPTETIFEYREFPDILDADGNPVRVVSPQGWAMSRYTDLGGLYTLGGGGDVRYDGNAEDIQTKVDFTYATGSHTFKAGTEFDIAELEYHYEYVDGIMASVANGEYRDYGGDWPTPTPTYLGFFVQDKFESEGMIANVGIRVERFRAGQDAYAFDDMFNDIMFGTGHGQTIFNELMQTLYNGEQEPDPWEILASDDIMGLRSESRAYWRVAPRFGISHPVSSRTKFFFNFGQFYSRQKSAVLYGFLDADIRYGYGGGRVGGMSNPNLRPAKTTAYETGIEQVFPWQLLLTVRGYAKFNTDQVSSIDVKSDAGVSYTTYRNGDFEDIRGLEIKLSRAGGRFVNGWFTYERTRIQGGHVGYKIIVDQEQDVEPFVPWSRDARPQGSFQGALILSTPRDWGALRGGWTATLVQTYRAGGETYYNPDPTSIPLRELPEENWFPVVDYWNTNLKLSKTLDLPGGRFVAVSFDIENLWNTKRLNGTWRNGTEYKKFIYEQRKEYARRRANGESTEGANNYSYGDPTHSTS